MLVLLPVLAFTGACSLLPDAESGCDKPQPYQSAQDAQPLRVPDGAVAPDTRNAMRIPAVNVPQVPAGAGRCLDHPPSYGVKPAAG
jgi:uncharacterized lipoprotein